MSGKKRTDSKRLRASIRKLLDDVTEDEMRAIVGTGGEKKNMVLVRLTDKEKQLLNQIAEYFDTSHTRLFVGLLEEAARRVVQEKNLNTIPHED